MMTWWHKINPFNRLFGRIFVWFWLAVLCILSSAFLLVRYMSLHADISAATERRLIQGEMLEQRIQQLMRRGVPLASALRRVGERGRWLLIATHTRPERTILNFPAPLIRHPQTFQQLRNSEQAVAIRLANAEFTGPFVLNTAKGEYGLYIGRLLPRKQQDDTQTALIAGILLAIVTSAGFCFVLVSSLTRPLARISHATKRMAQGDLAVRIASLQDRKDEVGQLAQDFNHMAKQLEQVLDSQKQLMANVSHELRSPLTRLQLSVALLTDSLANDSAQARNIARIENEIAKMDKLIGETLTLAKLNADQLKTDMQFHQLSDVLAPVFEDAQFEAEQQNKHCHYPDIPTISVLLEPSIFRSAIENVIRNAIRFADKVIQIDISVSDLDYCISVCDDGPGLSEAALKQVLEPFYRANTELTINATGTGTGLGLAIAKAAVELHRGSISISNAEKGLRVEMKFIR